jgi:hypothetical protein
MNRQASGTFSATTRVAPTGVFVFHTLCGLLYYADAKMYISTPIPAQYQKTAP